MRGCSWLIDKIECEPVARSMLDLRRAFKRLEEACAVCTSWPRKSYPLSVLFTPHAIMGDGCAYGEAYSVGKLSGGA